MFDELATGAATWFPAGMARPRIDPAAPGEGVGAVVPVAVRDRVIELAAERGTSRSAVVRELLEDALDALEDGDGEQ
jgi:Ribbon-helix-helix protein, copG family